MIKIIHIPHSSTKIPEEFLSDYILPLDKIFEESELMCDKNTNLLVDPDTENVIIFPYSRIFCDVERFNNNSEEMNKVGMGVMYTHTHDSILMRKIKNESSILKYYFDHHNKFNELLKKLLKENDEVLIIDLHSYSNIPLEYELHKNLNRPDICLGIDYHHISKEILKKILYIVQSFNFTFEVNQPFIGSFVPYDYYHKDDRVKSIMIEINKNVINNNFQKIKELIRCITEI